MDVLSALSSSSKGKLSYDGDWLRDGRIQEVLESCISPPFVRLPEKQYSHTTLLNVSAPELSPPSKPPPLSPEVHSTITKHEQIEKSVDLTQTFSNMDTTRVKLKRLELSWKDISSAALEERRLKFERHTAMVNEESEAKLMDHYWKRDEILCQEEEDIMKEERLRLKELQQRSVERRETSKQHERKVQKRLLEAEAERKHKEAVAKQLEQEAKRRIATSIAMHKEILKIKDAVVKELDSYGHKPELSPEVWKLQDTMKTAASSADHVIASLHQSGKISVSEMKLVSDRKDQVENIQKLVNKHMRVANEKVKSQAAKAVEAAKLPAAVDKTVAVVGAATAAGAQGDVIRCVSDAALQRYERVMRVLEQTKRDLAPLLNTTDRELKKYKFELQKAVGTLINTISGLSGRHLREKVEGLYRLLSGHVVEVAGSKVTAAKHPAGQLFCRYLFAKKIVEQGDTQVDTKPETAFPIAMVTVGIWAESAETGDLLLAHLYTLCPYACPYYLPKKEETSDAQYYRSLGYKYEDGKVEEQDKFLRRQAGFLRLYASILTAAPPRGNHPHGLPHAWQWLCDVINMDPRPDITAQAIYDMISVCGNSLMKRYGQQFRKLLRLLCMSYMPKIKQATPEGAQGAVTRLQNYLEQCVKDGAIPAPEGFLTAQYWQSI